MILTSWSKKGKNLTYFDLIGVYSSLTSKETEDGSLGTRKAPPVGPSIDMAMVPTGLRVLPLLCMYDSRSALECGDHNNRWTFV